MRGKTGDINSKRVVLNYLRRRGGEQSVDRVRMLSDEIGVEKGK